MTTGQEVAPYRQPLNRCRGNGIFSRIDTNTCKSNTRTHRTNRILRSLIMNERANL
jgi:hypothetical protein